ncbi:MAG TPA: Sjogren's syndrome/scleroderma autoantigen 1 family protein [Nitrososphaeraceae archaeon]|nr:Sjogren's syndrome/scleroderma autoantigen 1 family protein [Nitrososphaeraceae archaeon]
MSASDDQYRKKLKNAADFLLSGGTLLSEPCNKCSGIQIRTNKEIKCIICGNTTLPENNATKEIAKIVDSNHTHELREKIRKRLNDLINSVGSDKNLVEEDQRLRVIDNYFRILEKIKLLD